MAQFDVSGLSYILPIVSFLFVTLIVYAILDKTKILGENKWINAIIGILLGFMFVVVASIREYITTVIPWLIVLLITMFFIIILISFSQKDADKLIKPGFSWVFVILLVIIFIIAAIKVFNPVLSPFFYGAYEPSPGNFVIGSVADFIMSSQFWGTLLLVVIAVIVAFIITRKAK
jgi:hypothetical protein